MATDGTRIYYNRAFVDGLTPAELEGVLAHEVMHCALGHHCRRGGRDSRRWNEAADLAINPILLNNSFALPAGALFDPACDNLSAEEIYARLEKQGSESGSNNKSQQGGGAGQTISPNTQPPSPSQPTQPSSPSSTANCPSPSLGHDASQSGGSSDTAEAQETQTARPGGFGEVLDATDDQGKPVSPAERSRQQHEWAIAAEQAVRMARTCGHEPANVERALSETRESKQDWRAILRTFVAATTASDYRWTPPNRRHIASGLYLPSVDHTGVGAIVIGVDTSGSIGQKELEQFAGEITAISDEMQPEVIYVVYCDAAVQATQAFGAGDPIQLEPKGGGGTDFRPVFQWVEANDIQPQCLVYLTDLCCRSYPEVPEYPVLWVTDSRTTAPFGETIRIYSD
jgi:predicted metal-dependent peptidase